MRPHPRFGVDPDFLSAVAATYQSASAAHRSVAEKIRQRATKAMERGDALARHVRNYCNALEALLERGVGEEEANETLESVLTARDSYRALKTMHHTLVAGVEHLATKGGVVPVREALPKLRQLDADLDDTLEDYEDAVRFQPDIEDLDEALRQANSEA